MPGRLDNVYVTWALQEYFTGDVDVWITIPEERYLDVGNFRSCIVSAYCNPRSALDVKIETSMTKTDDDDFWEQCTNGSLIFASNPEVKTIDESDAIPLRRWLRFKVGDTGSSAWTGWLTLRLLLKR